jgi:hypothetical protein
MSAERWRQVSALFEAAAALDPEGRRTFLERACPEDPTLRAEVESLLVAHAAADGFLSRQAAPPGSDGGPTFAEGAAPSAPATAVLSPGQRLGVYEIAAFLGAGGMGQVYRARDPRLSREVAVKVLPAGLEQAPERVRRFTQEARAAGQLNHPNILAIYDVGTHAGAPYLVSELLVGETLRERLAGGKRLPWRRAVEIAAQIARGLAAAHAAGIVHRDLKPENVFMTRDGRVKILDFGLAKLTQGEGAEATTQAGVVMGTVGYMSPEQVRGEAVDPRSDLFALGAILHEALAGTPPFRRGAAMETLAAILSDEPPDLAAGHPELPPALLRIVRRCLEKQLEARFQSASDLAFQLELLAGASEAAAAAVPAVAGRRTRPATRRAVLAAAALAAAVALAAAGLLAGLRLGAAPTPSFRQLTFGRGTVHAARFAPDGASVLYTAAWEGGPVATYAMRLDTLSPRPLELPPSRLLAAAPGEMALLLPQGPASLGSLAYYASIAQGTLARAPLDGGAPRPVLANVIDADWGPAGERFAVVRRTGGETQIEFPIGTILYRTAGGIGSPRIAPDGRRIAFVEYDVIDDSRGRVMLADAAGARSLGPRWADLGGLAWRPDGKEVWFTAAGGGYFRNLRAVRLDGRERLVARTPGRMVLEDIAADGRVLFEHAHYRSEVRGTSPGDPAEHDLSWYDWTHANDLSADGRQLLFTEEGEEAGPSLAAYLRDTAGHPTMRLGQGHATALSPDGRWAISHLRAQKPPQLVLLPTGPGAPRPLPRGPIAELHWAWWLPDGRRLLVLGNEAGRPARLYLQAVGGGPPRPLSAEGVTATGQAPVSPDGRRVIVATPDAATPFALLAVADGRLVSLTGMLADDEPIRWSPDGRSIYLKSGEAGPATKVVRLAVAGGRREVWRELRAADPAGVTFIGDVLLTPDTTTYAYTYHRNLTDLFLGEGLR